MHNIMKVCMCVCVCAFNELCVKGRQFSKKCIYTCTLQRQQAFA